MTFVEGLVKTKAGHQALIMDKLRCFAMNLIRWSKKGIKNFQATIEEFTDSAIGLRINFYVNASELFMRKL